MNRLDPEFVRYLLCHAIAGAQFCEDRGNEQAQVWLTSVAVVAGWLIGETENIPALDQAWAEWQSRNN